MVCNKIAANESTHRGVVFGPPATKSRETAALRMSLTPTASWQHAHVCTGAFSVGEGEAVGWMGGVRNREGVEEVGGLLGKKKISPGESPTDRQWR